MLFVAFPLLLLIFFSLCLIFVSLINVCLGMFLFGFILYGTLWASWTWVAISFPMLRNFSTIIPQIFSHTLSFSLLLWDPYKSNAGAFNIVPEVSETVLISFFFILFCFSYFHHSIFQLSQLFCYWFLLVYFKFQLLCCSLLIACSLVLLGPCKLFLVSSQSLSPFYLSVPPFYLQGSGSFLLPLL